MRIYDAPVQVILDPETGQHTVRRPRLVFAWCPEFLRPDPASHPDGQREHTVPSEETR